MKTIRKVGAAFAATLLSVVAFMPSASAIQVGGYKKCNFTHDILTPLTLSGHVRDFR